MQLTWDLVGQTLLLAAFLAIVLGLGKAFVTILTV